MSKSKGKTVKTNKGPLVDEDGYERLGGDNSPLQVGEMVEGVFGGAVRSLPAKGKGKPPIPIYQIGSREVLGGTVLRRMIEEGKVQPGDSLKVTRLEDAAAKKGQNAAKLFDVRVKRK